jgi:hypothetical protein
MKQKKPGRSVYCAYTSGLAFLPDAAARRFGAAGQDYYSMFVVNPASMTDSNNEDNKLVFFDLC